MGFFDALNSEMGREGLAMLAAAGPQAQPMNFGQRMMLAQALHARQCPHLSFCLDESITKGNEVMHIIQESMDELARDADRSRQGSAAADPTSEGATG